MEPLLNIAWYQFTLPRDIEVTFENFLKITNWCFENNINQADYDMTSFLQFRIIRFKKEEHATLFKLVWC